MSKNLYTRAVDSIKAPEDITERVLSAAQRREKKENVIFIRKPAKALIAASVALALLIGGFFGVYLLSPQDSPFTLTVNAAEITEGSYTDIGTLDVIGGNLTTDEANPDHVVMTEIFAFNVKVEGEHVDTVSYSVTGGEFGSVEPVLLNGGEDSGLIMIHQSDIVSPEEDEKNFTKVWIRADSWDSTLPEDACRALLDWNNHANVKLGLEADENFDDSAFDIVSCKQTLYDALLERLKVKVHISYLDERVEEREILFSCAVCDGGAADIYAKLI